MAVIFIFLNNNNACSMYIFFYLLQNFQRRIWMDSVGKFLLLEWSIQKTSY